MADEEYDYDGDYFEDGDNFFYVEETYALADDLTENVIPDPGGFYDHTDDWDDMTRFDYWNDIEYDSDGYNDRAGLPVTKLDMDQDSDPSQGRKRKAVSEANKVSKRPKLSRNKSTFLRELPPIMFVSDKPEKAEPVADVSTMVSYSIMPDWRERFKNIKSVVNVSAEARVPTIEEIWSGSDEESQQGTIDDDGTTDPTAAMEGLSLSLARHLAKVGLDTSRIDQLKLLALAQKIMTDEEDAEDLLADFIEDMYAEDGEEADNPLAKLIAGTKASKEVQAPDNGHVEPSSTGKVTGDTATEIQEPVFGSSVKVGDTSIPKTSTPVCTAPSKKRKPETPETSPKKRRNMNKRVST